MDLLNQLRDDAGKIVDGAEPELLNAVEGLVGGDSLTKVVVALVDRLESKIPGLVNPVVEPAPAPVMPVAPVASVAPVAPVELDTPASPVADVAALQAELAQAQAQVAALQSTLTPAPAAAPTVSDTTIPVVTPA